MTELPPGAEIAGPRVVAHKPFVWKVPIAHLRAPWCVMWLQPAGKFFRAAERVRHFHSWREAYDFAWRLTHTFKEKIP